MVEVIRAIERVTFGRQAAPLSRSPARRAWSQLVNLRRHRASKMSSSEPLSKAPRFGCEIWQSSKKNFCISLINRLNGVGAVSFQIAKKEGADIFETVDDINRRIKLQSKSPRQHPSRHRRGPLPLCRNRLKLFSPTALWAAFGLPHSFGVLKLPYRILGGSRDPHLPRWRLYLAQCGGLRAGCDLTLWIHHSPGDPVDDAIIVAESI